MFIPGLGYAFLVKRSKPDISFRDFFRNSKKELFISTLIFSISTLLAIYFIDYPPIVNATLVSLISWKIVNAIFNLKFRISYHLGDIALLLVSLWFIIGRYSLFGIILIPVVAISKRRAGHHTITQMIIGFLAAAFITAFVFKEFGF
jgi:hypothetical protein